MYDVAIIGAGVVGGLIGRVLSKYKLKICIVDKECDVAMGATKANSAIVHAGFDAKAGTLKALLNKRGSDMMEELCCELGVAYKRNGSLVLGFDDEDKEILKGILENGIKNGVQGLEILDYTQIKKIEPNISDNVKCALYAPTGAIVCPYGLAEAAIGNAMDNGAELMLNRAVGKIEEENNYFKLYFDNNENLYAKIVINAAGVYADEIAKMIGDCSFEISPRKGEYILLDKEIGVKIKHTLFTVPTKMGKGILVSPTVDGNLILGPTAVDIKDKECKATTKEGFDKIITESSRMVKCAAINMAVTSFVGLRSVGSTGDFIINMPVKGFVNVAGIESPGLSASPAIAEYVVELLKNSGFSLQKREDFNPYRENVRRFSQLSIDERNEIIKKEPSYGRVICRCENITEGEIVKAIRSNPPATSLDGIKRRTRAQMGRCQGGFCSPYITKILSRELNISPEKVLKDRDGSNILVGRTKEDLENA